MDLVFRLGDTDNVSATFTPDGAGGNYSFINSEVLSGWGYFFYMNSNSNSDGVIGQFRNDPNASMYSNQVLDASHVDYRKQVTIGAAYDTITSVITCSTTLIRREPKLGR